MQNLNVLEASVPQVAATLTKKSPRPRHSAVAEPWKRSWFYCAPGEISTFGWLVLLHAAALTGLVLVPSLGGSLWPGWPVAISAVALTILGGLGTTVCYHRSLTHGGVQLRPFAENVLIFFAMLNGSGKPSTWVANHRLHHSSSDTDEDISSPMQGGFWWAHLRWLWQAGQAPVARYAPDLERPIYRFWGAMQVPILALSFFGGLYFGVAACLWLGPLRLLWALHAQCTINSVCHFGDSKAIGGSSKNVWWLAPLHFLQGENWHRNHHEEPTDARLGQSKIQLDLGWWSIMALKFCGLAARIRRPRATSS